MSGRFCIDANGFITAWDVYYRPMVIPSLWQQLAINKNEIILLEPIFNEIQPMSQTDRKLPQEEQRQKYPLRFWLTDNGFSITSLTPEVETLSLQLENQYETDPISKGAGQVDISLIAYAKIMNKTVVTYEGPQPQPPKNKCNYKIPLICQEQDVECIEFITMLERLRIRI